MKILSRGEVEPAVVNLVLGARKTLLLVSPYFAPWNRLTLAIESAITVNYANTVIIIRGGKDFKKQFNAAKQFQDLGAKVYALERLHAKVYLSEKEAIVASMNLL